MFVALEWKQRGLLYRTELCVAHVWEVRWSFFNLALRNFPGHWRDWRMSWTEGSFIISISRKRKQGLLLFQWIFPPKLCCYLGLKMFSMGISFSKRIDLTLAYLSIFICYHSPPPSLCSSHTEIFAISQTGQAGSHWRAFALAIPQTRKALPIGSDTAGFLTPFRPLLKFHFPRVAFSDNPHK